MSPMMKGDTTCNFSSLKLTGKDASVSFSVARSLSDLECTAREHDFQQLSSNYRLNSWVRQTPETQYQGLGNAP